MLVALPPIQSKLMKAAALAARGTSKLSFDHL